MPAGLTCAVVAEGTPPRRPPQRQPDGEHGEQEAAKVAEQVGGVRHHRQAVGQVAAQPFACLSGSDGSATMCRR